MNYYLLQNLLHKQKETMTVFPAVSFDTILLKFLDHNFRVIKHKSHKMPVRKSKYEQNLRLFGNINLIFFTSFYSCFSFISFFILSRTNNIIYSNIIHFLIHKCNKNSTPEKKLCSIFLDMLEVFCMQTLHAFRLNMGFTENN